MTLSVCGCGENGGAARRLLSSVGLSAASAVQVFILGAGLAEVHERGVCLESSATCRTTREVNLRAAVESGTVHTHSVSCCDVSVGEKCDVLLIHSAHIHISCSYLCI